MQNKSIWHTADEKPNDEFGMVVYYSKEYDEELLVGYYNTEYEEFRPLDEYYCEEKTVKKWCYLNDLMALETELKFTRKALDVAVDEITKIKVAAESVGIGFFMTAAIFALTKINTALEQKDVK